MTYDSLKHIDGTHISILDSSKFSNFRLKRDEMTVFKCILTKGISLN